MSDYALSANIGADTSDFDSAMQDLTSSLSQAAQQVGVLGDQGSDAGDKLEGGMKKGEESVSGLGSSIEEMGKKLLAAFAVEEIGRKLVEFAGDAIASFAKAETASENLKFSMEKIGGASAGAYSELIDWTEKYSNSLNNLYSPAELESSEAQLATLGLNADQIKKLIPLLGDYAQVNNQGLAAATDKAAAAIRAHTRGLRDIGGEFVNTGSAAGNYATLLTVLGKVQGMAAGEMHTTTNEMKEQTNQMDLMEESIGKKIAPAWMNFKQALLTGADGILHFRSSQAEAVAQLVQQGQVTQEVADQVNKAGSIWDSVADRVKAARDAMANIKNNENGPSAFDLTGGAWGTQGGEAQAKTKADTGGKGLVKGGIGDEVGKSVTGVTDKIKTLDEITKEADAHMKAFGESKMETVKKEVEELNSSMQKLFEKGQQNTEEFKNMASAKASLESRERTRGLTTISAPSTVTGIQTGEKPPPEQDAADKAQADAMKNITDMANQAKAAMQLFGSTNLSRLNSSLVEVEDEMIKLKASGGEGSQAWQGLIVQQQTLKTTIDNTTAAMEKMKQKQMEAQAVSKGAAAAMASVASAGISAAASGKNPGAAIMKMLGQMATQKGEFYLGLGAADILTGVGAGMGALELAGGAALIALGAKMSAVQMASGGVVSGSAIVNVGEYPGAAHNPEVIAPLDKLHGMMNKGGNQSHTFNVEGPRLVSVLDKVNTNTMFHIGGGGA